MGIMQIVCLSIGCDIDGCENGKDFYGADYDQAWELAADAGWTALDDETECRCPEHIEKESCAGLLREAGLTFDQFIKAAHLTPGSVALIESGGMLLRPSVANAYRERVARVAREKAP